MRVPRRTVMVAVAATLAVLLSTFGLGAAYAHTSEIPRGTTVMGVDIGGLSRARAEAALTAGLGQRAEILSAPVTVRIGDATTEISPEAVGLAVDVEASVARAAAQSRNPLRVLFGGQRIDPVVVVDTNRLHTALSDTAEKVGEATTMPEITFKGTDPVATYPEPGLGLDPERSAAALTAGWPPAPPPADGWVEPPVIRVPLVEIVPVTTATEVDRLLADLARPAVAAPVTIETPDGGTLRLEPEVIADSLRLTADSRGEIVPSIDPGSLREGLADQLTEVESEPVDAHFILNGGRPSVADGVPGRVVDLDRLATDLLEVLAGPAPRLVSAAMTASPVEVTAADLSRLGVSEQVSTFTTYFDGGLQSPRTQNIIRVAEMVDGALVRPGETFSLNGHTGERSYEQGFQDAPIILDGRLQPGVGGGISQFTTTLFNAAFYAGLEDVEHHPHSYWYSRYPSVLEATIFYPTLDLKFRNNTPNGILIDTSSTSSSITVTMWGTKVWDDVTARWDAKRDIVEPRTRYVEPGPTCIASQGINGFTQDAWRVFHRDGAEVEQERFTWRYDAQPQVICDREPEEEAPDGDDS